MELKKIVYNFFFLLYCKMQMKCMLARDVADLKFDSMRFSIFFFFFTELFMIIFFFSIRKVIAGNFRFAFEFLFVQIGLNCLKSVSVC